MQIVAAVLDAAPSAVTAQDLSGTPLHTHSRARALTAHTHTHTHTHTHIQAVPHYISWRVTLN